MRRILRLKSSIATSVLSNAAFSLSPTASIEDIRSSVSLSKSLLNVACPVNSVRTFFSKESNLLSHSSDDMVMEILELSKTKRKIRREDLLLPEDVVDDEKETTTVLIFDSTPTGCRKAVEYRSREEEGGRRILVAVVPFSRNYVSARAYRRARSKEIARATIDSSEFPLRVTEYDAESVEWTATRYEKSLTLEHFFFGTSEAERRVAEYADGKITSQVAALRLCSETKLSLNVCTEIVERVTGNDDAFAIFRRSSDAVDEPAIPKGFQVDVAARWFSKKCNREDPLKADGAPKIAGKEFVDDEGEIVVFDTTEDYLSAWHERKLDEILERKRRLLDKSRTTNDFERARADLVRDALLNRADHSTGALGFLDSPEETKIAWIRTRYSDFGEDVVEELLRLPVIKVGRESMLWSFDDPDKKRSKLYERSATEIFLDELERLVERRSRIA